MRAAGFLVVGLFAVQAVATHAKQASFLAARRGSSHDTACPPCEALMRPGFNIAGPPTGSSNSQAVGSSSGCHCESATSEVRDGDLNIDFYPDEPVTLEKLRDANYKAFVTEILKDTDKEVWARAQTLVQRSIALQKAKEELVQMALLPSPEARLVRSDNITKELQEVIHNITKAAEKAGATAQKEEDKILKAQEKGQVKKGSKAKLFGATSEVEELLYGGGAPKKSSVDLLPLGEKLVESQPKEAAPPVLQAPQKLLSTGSEAEQFAISPVIAQQYDLAPVTDEFGKLPPVLIHEVDAPAKTKAAGTVKFLPVSYVN